MNVSAANARPMYAMPAHSVRAGRTNTPAAAMTKHRKARIQSSCSMRPSYQARSAVRSVSASAGSCPREDLGDGIWAQKRRRPRGTSRGRRLGGWSCGGALVGSVQREPLGLGELRLDLLDRQAASGEGEQLDQERNGQVAVRVLLGERREQRVV